MWGGPSFNPPRKYLKKTIGQNKKHAKYYKMIFQLSVQIVCV